MNIGKLSTEEALKQFSQMKDEISIDLTDENFEHLTQAATGATTGDWFVYFYDPSCKNCSYFKPVWRMVAKEVRDEHLPVNIAKMDASKNPETTARFRINSFPSLLYFHKGKYYTYTGNRDETDILKTIREGTYTQFNRKKVPEPRTYFTDAMKIARWLVFRVPREYPLYSAIGLSGFVIAMIAVCYYASKEDNPEPKEQEQVQVQEKEKKKDQ